MTGIPHQPRFDAAIIGLGAMGSATAMELARAGGRILAFDTLAPPHRLGSTHGRTRIIREAYYEHPLYVPLVRRAYDLWARLELESNRRLFVQTGGVMAGAEGSGLVRGALESAHTHRVDHEILDSKELTRRFPAYRAPNDWIAVLEKRAGMLFPEQCVSAMLDAAQASGADLHREERVSGWRIGEGGVTVATTRGTYMADRLVVAAGPWLSALVESLGVHVPVEVERQLSHWFAPQLTDGRYDATRCPIGLWEASNGEIFATLPDGGDGVICGMHHAGAATDPERVNRAVSETENATARAQLDAVMPGAAGRLLEARVCLYTNTPDRHFIIDWTERGRVLLVSACSGHGFKFATAIGEIAAQLLSGGRTELDLTPFSLSRFSKHSA